MASKTINGGKIVFSNSKAAVAETFYATDAGLYTVQYFDVLSRDGGGGSKILWSLGTSEVGANGCTIQGSVSFPTELLAQDTAYNIDNSTYRSALGANIFLTGATGLVGYDLSALNAVTRLQIDDLALGKSVTDSFDYAIRLGDGTLSWNTVTVLIGGAAANVTVIGGYVVEGQNIGSDGRLSDTESIAVKAASGDATSFTIKAKSADTLGSITGVGGTLNADGSYTFAAGSNSFTYAVTDDAVLASHFGYGESQKEWFTITTANGTTADFYETVYGQIDTPVVTASAAQTSIEQGGSVRLNISATDGDDNASLSYAIGGVPAGAVLKSAANPGGISYDPTTQLWTVAAGALADLTLTLGPQYTPNLDLTVTVTNTETNPNDPNDIATALATASIEIAVSGGSFEVGAGTTVSGVQIGNGDTEFVRSGGTAAGTTISDGGTQIVATGGAANGTTIGAGGAQTVQAGGTAVDTTISDGGFQDVFGTATNTSLYSGARQTIELGATASGTLLDDDAVQTVYGTATDTLVESGDTQLVEPGGVATGTTIETGGVETVLAGGETVDTTIAGGTLELDDGAIASGTITFSGGGGILQIDGSAMPATPISGFTTDDEIDLRGLAFGTGASVSFDAATGLLTVNGNTIATLTLSGLAAGTSFTVALDGEGGTLIREAPPPPNYTYTILDVPSASQTVPLDVNDNGGVVGYYTAGGLTHSFLYSNGIYTTLDQFPVLGFGSQDRAVAINDSGQVVGNSQFSPFSLAYLYSNGNYTNANFDFYAVFGFSFGSVNSYASGINDAGAVVGTYNINGFNGAGYIYDNGSYTVIADPNSASFLGTTAYAINDANQVLGYSYDSSFVRNDFLYSDGTYTRLDDPDASFGTLPVALNNSGEVVGTYYDIDHTAHGFIYSDGTYSTLDDPDASNGTYITGLDDSGEVIGHYGDATGTHGFLYSNGAFSTLDSGVSGFSTNPNAISDSGNIVGTLSAPSPEGFLFSDDVYTTLIAPSASDMGATGINDSGQVAGSYYDGISNHGFLYDNGNITTLDDPFAAVGNGTLVSAINNAGDVLGNYWDSNGYTHGFIYSDGGYTDLDVGQTIPFGYGTDTAAMNNTGDVVGSYDTTEAVNGSYQHAFLYSNGTYTSLDAPGASSTFATGINDSDEIAGSADSHGFLYSNDSYLILDAPGAYRTTPLGINNEHEVIGSYNDNDNFWHGFIYDSGTYTVLDAPGAVDTYVTGFNDMGQIAGYYSDDAGTNHGFLYDQGAYTVLDAPLGTNGTLTADINNSGQIVGSYYPVGEHGFLAVRS